MYGSSRIGLRALAYPDNWDHHPGDNGSAVSHVESRPVHKMGSDNQTPNGKGFLVKKIENATDYSPVPGGLFLSGIWGRISLCMKGSLFQRSV